MTFIRLLALVLLFSCDPKEPIDPCDTLPPEGGDVGESMYTSTVGRGVEFIIDELDWFDLEEGTDEQQCLGESIAVLYHSTKGYRCTAFKVGKRRVMTNNHCATSQYSPLGLRVSFNFSEGNEAVWYSCDTLIATNAELDYSLLECDESMSGVPFISLKDTFSAKGIKDVYLLHHNCDYYNEPGCAPYKKVSEGELLRLKGSRLFHSADSLGGTSGAPIFDKATNRIIGIHNSGYYHPTKPEPYGIYNAGHSMEEVIKDLDSKGQDIE